VKTVFDMALDQLGISACQDIKQGRDGPPAADEIFGHIALTPDPAHESARVLAVRGWR
jgi:hypothetical protein